MQFSAIKAYSGVVAAVAKKQQVLSRILQELINTEESRANAIAAFVEKNKEKMTQLSRPITTDSDILDFNELFKEGEETFGAAVTKQVEEVLGAVELTEDEKKAYRSNLWDSISDELVQALNLAKGAPNASEDV